jgi:hypothetical protein
MLTQTVSIFPTASRAIVTYTWRSPNDFREAAMSATSTACPQLPPELAQLGKPDEVFDLAASKHSSHTKLVIGACLVFMVISFVIAVPMLACGIKPFGKTPPPPAIAFGFGGLSLALGLGLAYGAYYLAYESRAGAESYHLFPQVLVVLTPAGARQIEWERIGPEKKPSAINPQHVFSVDDGDDIRFDQMAADHEALEMAITHRSTKARWTRLLSPAPGLSDQASPAFLAHDPSDRGLYRVSRLSGRLLFARLGDGCAMGTRGFAPLPPAGAPGGVAGGYVAWAQAQHVERMQAVLDRFEGIGDRELFDLAAALPGGRLVSVEELSSVELSPPSTWQKMSTGVKIALVLQFRHLEWGEKTMYLESRPQAALAAEVLQTALPAGVAGDVLAAVR